MSTALQTAERRSLLLSMANKYGMEAKPFQEVLMATVMPQNARPEHLAAFLVVANEYGLNPFTKEIYAFPSKGGGVQPMVSIDGWIHLVNSHKQCDGFELVDVFDEDHMDQVRAVEVRMYRKDRTHPVVVREYMAECQRETEPWKRWPRRMLRHKAFVQGARLAFGFAGVMDEDEYERMVEAETSTDHLPPPSAKLTTRMSLQNAKPATPRDEAGGGSIAETLRQSEVMFDGADSAEDPT